MTPPLDLDAIERTITDNALRGIFAAPIIMDLVRELREARKERPAVVAWLRKETWPCCSQCNGQIANAIDRGEHRTDYR